MVTREGFDTTSELARIRARIIDCCNDLLAAGQPCYLSRLGNVIGNDDLLALKFFTKMRLSEYIQKELGDQFQLISVGPHQNIFAVVRVQSASVTPAAAQLSTAAVASNPYIERNPSEASPPSRPPRFNRRFWAAFAVPPVGPTRFLRLSDLYFTDNAQEPTQSEDWREIPAASIPPATADRRDDAILRSIDKWLEENDLQKERFLLSTSNQPLLPSALPATQGSLLDLLISALSDRQLQSVNLPLDVVAALQRRRTNL